MRPFSELFVGRDDAYGMYEVSPSAIPNERGKLEGRAYTRREPVTDELYLAHLDGQQSLGIVPIRIDGTAMWFAIDVDTYDNASLHTSLLKKIAANDLPLVMTKSKSGGAHLWCFLTEAMQARDIREVAKQFLAILGLPSDTEIFPKQVEVDKENVGNWINLPFFGDTRFGVVLKGEELVEIDAEKFVKLANKTLAKPEDISHRHAEPEQLEKVEKEGSEAPPCIDSFEVNGVPEGGRDNAVFHVATYMKRAHPDDWQDQLQDWNAEHCEPPLLPSEVRRIAGGHERTTYQYKCDDKPMCDVCSKKLCKTRKFGVGGGSTNEELPFKVGGLRKIDSEEPVYYLEVNGEEVRLSIDDLLDWGRLAKRVTVKLNIYVPHIKQQTWASALMDIFPYMIIEEAPSIVGETGLTLDLLARFLSDFCQDETREMALEGRPYVDGEKAYFLGPDFLSWMERHVKGVRKERVWSVLKEEAGAAEHEFDKENSKYKLWVLPWKGEAKEGSAAF